MVSKAVRAAKIRKAANILADELRPEKIILFGSYAYGKPNKDSDVDLLIIKNGKQKSRDYALRASKLLVPRPFPVDILVRTSANIRWRLKWGDNFFEEIMKKGRLLYEKSHH